VIENIMRKALLNLCGGQIETGIICRLFGGRRAVRGRYARQASQTDPTSLDFGKNVCKRFKMSDLHIRRLSGASNRVKPSQICLLSPKI
jgi:hypothetical protein